MDRLQPNNSSATKEGLLTGSSRMTCTFRKVEHKDHLKKRNDLLSLRYPETPHWFYHPSEQYSSIKVCFIPRVPTLKANSKQQVKGQGNVL